MQLSFRTHHLLRIFSLYETTPIPLDIFLSNYFRATKAIGSHDRKFLGDTVYNIIRWKGLIDYLCTKPISWEKRIEFYSTFSPEQYLSNPDIPDHNKVSFPKIYFDALTNSFSKKEALEICLTSNTVAPTTVRVNTLKTKREILLKKWKNEFSISPCESAENGIIFHKKINFFTLPEFKEGLFEIQDEASQLIADLVNAKPGEKILDYCSGSGGKTLAFAPKMNNKGLIYLHDVRSHPLEEARKRLRRAGVQNSQFYLPDDPQLAKAKGHFDCVLADVPCSGSGTLRRNPDLKWKFHEDTIKNLVSVQREICQKAISFLKPGGRFIYSTCSILKEENVEQLEYLTKELSLELVSEPFQSIPKKDKMDGFFGAVLRKK